MKRGLGLMTGRNGAIERLKRSGGDSYGEEKE